MRCWRYSGERSRGSSPGVADPDEEFQRQRLARVQRVAVLGGRLAGEGRSHKTVLSQTPLVGNAGIRRVRRDAKDRPFPAVDSFQFRPAPRRQVFIFRQRLVVGSHYGVLARGEARAETAIALPGFPRSAQGQPERRSPPR